MGGNQVTLHNVKKRFLGPDERSFLVLNIDALTLPSGQLNCILGPTGCGKSTLLDLIASVDGEHYGNISYNFPQAPRLACMFQKDLLLPWRTVLQNVTLGLEVYGLEADTETAYQWIDQLNLSGFAHAYPSQLSVGMRQRVALCRTLMVNGNLLLLDEPLSSQDFPTRVALEKMLRTYLVHPDSVSVFVTHNIEEAIVLADRIIVLSGRPSHIVDDMEVEGIPKDKDPIEIRRNAAFGSYVSRLAASLTKEMG